MMDALIKAFVAAVGPAVAGLVAITLLVGQAAAMYALGWHERGLALQHAQDEAALDQLAKVVAATTAEQGARANYVQQQADTRVIFQTLREEIPHATTQYRPAPHAAPQPLPRCVFTAAFVGVWNHALQAPGDLHGASLPGPTAGAAAAPGGAEAAGALQDAGVTQADLLANHVDNGEACAATRQQLNALIDYEERRKAAGHE